MGVSASVRRDCPICGGAPKGQAFPYRTRFNNFEFDYLKCASCTTVFVDPVPDAATFSLMYAKADYHDCHYEGIDRRAYAESVAFLSRHFQSGKRVLDYGCGAGYFLGACVSRGLVAIGVEFDADEARAASELTGCRTYSVAEFDGADPLDLFDVIHLGDVLEHLPNPLGTLTSLVDRLAVGGLVYVEGPPEVNPSPVYWFARAFGWMKRLVRPGAHGSHPPTHLFRTDAPSQRDFFLRLGKNYRLVDWKIEETGWPYVGGGLVKNAVAGVAKRVGGRHLFGLVFGNRFKGIFIKLQTDGASDDRGDGAVAEAQG